MPEPSPASPTPDPRLGGPQAWLVWSAAVLFVLYLFGFQTGYSSVNSAIREEVGLSVAQVGLIAAAYTWSFAFFQLFSGALLDRFGARRVLLPAMVLMMTGVFLFARAESFGTMVVAQIVLALGACAGFVGAGYVGGRWFGFAKFSVMFGLVQAAASAFSAFSQNLIGGALETASWRELFTWIGFGGIALCVVGFLLIRDPSPPQPRDRSESLGKFFRDVLGSILEVARIGHVWIAALYGALCFGALLAAGAVWAPKFMSARGVPAEGANLSASVLWLGLALGCLVIPRWSDSLRRRKLPTLVGIGLQLAALLVLVLAPNLPLSALTVAWFVFGFGAAAHMLAFSAAADVVQVERIGTSAAIVNGTMFLASGFLIARPGQIASAAMDAGTPVSLELAAQASRPLAIGLAVAWLLALWIRESHPGRAESA